VTALFQIICNIKLSGGDHDADFRAVRKYFVSMADACQVMDDIERELLEKWNAQRE
jgi:hypothetical protein